MHANERTQRLYTKRALFYQRLFVAFLGWSKELEAFFRGSDYLGPSIKILDAGCGTGAVTKAVYQLAHEQGYAGIEFHAFDLTENMLAVFEKWITMQGANEVEARQADVLEIRSLPSHWNEYDLIVSSTMLEYLPTHEVTHALANLKQLLRVGGRLLVFVTKRNRITRWLAGRWWKARVYEQDEIEALFHDAGFDTVQFKRLSPQWSNSIMVIDAKA